MSTDQTLLLSSHSVVLQLPTTTNPNTSIPSHNCQCLRCLCLPSLITLEVIPVLCCCCCRKKKHPLWNKTFEVAVTTLRAGAYNIGRCWCALRCLTDPPLAVVPKWLPSGVWCAIPSGVGITTNTVCPSGGEWTYAARGPRASCCHGSSSSATCCCCGACCGGAYLGNPNDRSLPWVEEVDDDDQNQNQTQPYGSTNNNDNNKKNKNKNKKKRRVILYFHGGAFALCTPKTHRALLSKLCNYTNGADILCPNYRRPPEHPWPTPIDDCV